LQERDLARHSELARHIEGLWGGPYCAVVRCEACEFCFSQPFIAGDARFYELAYSDPVGYPTWKWEFEVTRDALVAVDHSRHTLLEVGAGDGAFIKSIADDIIPTANITCTEYSKYGMTQLGALGVRCLSVDVRALSGRDCPDGFDVVCMFQVLEHMDRLDVLFEKLRSLMKPGASLFIATPNPRLIEFNELHGALLDMPPNHVGRWNRRCLEEMGRRFRFDVVDHRIEKFGVEAVRKQFVDYLFARQAQKSGSLANRIMRTKHSSLRWRLSRLGVALASIQAIPALIRLDERMGNSQWTHLVKADD
jgi:Methyltransferase domain.